MNQCQAYIPQCTLWVAPPHTRERSGRLPLDTHTHTQEMRAHISCAALQLRRHPPPRCYHLDGTEENRKTTNPVEVFDSPVLKAAAGLGPVGDNGGEHKAKGVWGGKTKRKGRRERGRRRGMKENGKGQSQGGQTGHRGRTSVWVSEPGSLTSMLTGDASYTLLSYCNQTALFQ